MKFEEILSNTLETENGRQLIFEILEMTGINDTAYFTVNGTVNAYYQGKRTVGNELLNKIRGLNDGLEKELLMRREAKARPKPLRKDARFYDNFIRSEDK